jgi:chorismate synthase
MSRIHFYTAGESHGKGLVAIVEGMVAGLPLQAGYINHELKRRQQGYGRGPRMQIEEDKVDIISGVRYGLTIGSPIALLVENRDWQNWQETLSVLPVDKEAQPITYPRPGHADMAGVIKYGLSDIRPIIERASARETTMRVAAGAVARRFLEQFGIEIHSHTIGIGTVRLEESGGIDWSCVEESPVRCSDVRVGAAMMAEVDKARAEGDTLGGIFQLVAIGVPIGLGSHVSWDRKLDGRIARAIMSINAVKGIDSSNYAGGIEGGMSDGEDIVLQAVIKPIATLSNPLPSVDLRTGESGKAHYERSDVCVVPAAGVIGEAMLALVLADALLEKFGGDSLKETMANYNSYLSGIIVEGDS